MIGKRHLKNWLKKQINFSSLLLALFFIHNLELSNKVYSQGIDNYLSKKLGTTSNIPQRHYGIAITSDNKIVTSNLFGLAIFDGVFWKRKNIKHEGKKLSFLYLLRPSKYVKNNYVVAGLKHLGFIDLHENQVKFHCVANKAMYPFVQSHLVSPFEST